MLNAYKAYTQIKIQMYDTALYSKDLHTVAYGKEEQALTAAITDLRQHNLNFTGTPNSNPAVVSVAGNVATVQDCFGSATWIPVYTTGPQRGKSAVAPGSTVTAHPLTAMLNKLQDDKWRVVDATISDATC